MKEREEERKRAYVGVAWCRKHTQENNQLLSHVE